MNAEDNTWAPVADMKETRKMFQVVSCGKRMWALAGQVTNRTLNSTEFYDYVSDQWTVSTPLIENRREHASVAFRGKIYVIGEGVMRRMKS